MIELLERWLTEYHLDPARSFRRLTGEVKDPVLFDHGLQADVYPLPSPRRGRYLLRRRAANWTASVLDRMLAWGISQHERPAIPGEPKGILLCNGAHLGDLLLSTAVLPVLRSAYPGTRIAFLVGSWASDVVRDHPLVDRIHVVDHWKLNRTAASSASRMRRYFSSRARALREIRSERYDVAVDLYYYFPNSIPLLKQAGIPVRIGYTSGGFGPLLTHALDWTEGRHAMDYQADLLGFLPGVRSRETGRPRPALARLRPEAVLGLLARLGLGARGYLVLHTGAGGRFKEWPGQKWRALAARLASAGHPLVFTGSSGIQRKNADRVARGLDSAVNLCGQLGWREFVAVVENARALIGVDSVAGHVAATVGTPFVVISTGINPLSQWSPRGAPGHVLTHPVPCSPCYQSGGCTTMECVRGVRIEQVLGQLDRLISTVAPSGDPRRSSA